MFTNASVTSKAAASLSPAFNRTNTTFAAATVNFWNATNCAPATTANYGKYGKSGNWGIVG